MQVLSMGVDSTHSVESKSIGRASTQRGRTSSWSMGTSYMYRLQFGWLSLRSLNLYWAFYDEGSYKVGGGEDLDIHSTAVQLNCMLISISQV